MAQGLLALIQDSLPRAGRILEIGCGTGYFTQLLKQVSNGASMMALDLDAALVAAAARRLGASAGVAWLVADGETLSRGAFDAIVANASFQWLTRPAESLQTYLDLLNPGGVLAFSTLGPGTFRELADCTFAGRRRLASLPASRPLPPRTSWRKTTGPDY